MTMADAASLFHEATLREALQVDVAEPQSKPRNKRTTATTTTKPKPTSRQVGPAPAPEAKSPADGNAPEADETMETLKANYPHAREIERLPSGNYAVRFRRKSTKYVKR